MYFIKYMTYYDKYIKYKNKYTSLRKLTGGDECKEITFSQLIEYISINLCILLKNTEYKFDLQLQPVIYNVKKIKKQDQSDKLEHYIIYTMREKNPKYINDIMNNEIIQNAIISAKNEHASNNNLSLDILLYKHLIINGKPLTSCYFKPCVLKIIDRLCNNIISLKYSNVIDDVRKTYSSDIYNIINEEYRDYSNIEKIFNENKQSVYTNFICETFYLTNENIYIELTSLSEKYLYIHYYYITYDTKNNLYKFIDVPNDKIININKDIDEQQDKNNMFYIQSLEIQEDKYYKIILDALLHYSKNIIEDKTKQQIDKLIMNFSNKMNNINNNVKKINEEISILNIKINDLNRTKVDNPFI